jgi:hypothetical protein
MSLAIRPASLIEDREEMLDLMSRNFGNRREHRFAWSHINNPAGTAWAWIAHDSNGNGHKRAVAMVTVFPRNMRVDGKPVRAGQVGSFAVEPTHRSLGPAVLLQRTTFQPVDSGQLAFCYDCPPHDRGMSTFVRLGMKPDCEVYRYVFPLRVDDNVAKKLGRGLWTKPIAAAGNVLLRMRRPPSGFPGIEIQRLDGLFGDEFDHLDDITPGANLIRASRRARDLNYRYREGQDEREASTTGRIHVLVARRAGELQAFAVYLVPTDGIAVLLDVFGRELESAGGALLEATIAQCREQNLSSLHGFCSEESELRQLFLRTGLRRRERNCAVVGYTRRTGISPFGTGMRWAFSHVEVKL